MRLPESYYGVSVRLTARFLPGCGGRGVSIRLLEGVRAAAPS